MTARATLFCCFLCLVFISAGPAENLATAPPSHPEAVPAPLLPDDIWFYDSQMKQVVPRINPNWLTVVLTDGQAADTVAEALALSFRDIIDWFHDDSLMENACFIRLRPGMRLPARLSLMADLNRHPAVRYTHPVLELNNRPYVFDNVLDLRWKTGVADAVKERILKQVHVSKDPESGLYRVDLFETPLFRAANLLAEDVHVAYAAPSRIALTPPIRSEVSLSLNGGNVGDKLPFVFTVHFSNRVRIDPSAIATLDLRPAGIQRELYDFYLSPYDAVRSVSASPIRITGWIRIYTPGEFVIPPVDIKYTCEACADRRMRIQRTRAVPVKIASIVPGSWTKGNLIVPEAIPPIADEAARYREKARWHLAVALVSFFISAISVGLVFRFRKSRQDAPIQRPKIELGIWSEALETALKRISRTPDWRDAVNIGRPFRQLLAAAYEPPQAQPGGSGAVFYEAISAVVPVGIGPQILSLLTRLDDMVAEERAHCPEMHSLVSEVRDVLNEVIAVNGPSVTSAGSAARPDSREIPPSGDTHA